MTSFNRHSIIVAVVVALLAIAAGNANAQSVRGTLADGASGNALPYVNCVLLHSGDSTFAYGTTSNDKGEFAFKAVAEGEYLIRISYMGYETYLQPVGVRGAVDMGRIGLKKSSTVLSTVTISAEKPLYAMDGEKNLYNTKEDPSIKTGTISDALQNAPGVEVDAEGNITLRGVSSVEIWINDRPSHMQAEALKQYIKTMPADAIERIEVITNPSARYSTTGGVINIVTNQTVKRNELLCLGATARTTPSVSPWLSYVYANEKFDFNFYLNGDYTRHSWEGDKTTTMLDANGDTLRRTSSYDDGYNKSRGGYMGGNLNWKIDDKTNLAAWAGVYPYWQPTFQHVDREHYEYSPTLQDWSYDYRNDGHSFWGGGYIGAWFEHRYDTTGRKLSITMNGNGWLSRSHDTIVQDYRSATMSDFTRVANNRSYTPSLSVGANYTLPLKNKWELEMGIDVESELEKEFEMLDSLDLTTGTFNNIGLRSMKGNSKHLDIDGYVTVLKRWGGFTAKLGLRGGQCLSWVSYRHNVYGEQPTEVYLPDFDYVPSIHLSYSTKNFNNFSLNFTMRHSHNTAEEEVSFRQYDDDSYTVGNPDLEHSHTYNVEAAWNKYFMKFGTVGINAYMHANSGETGSITLVNTAYDPYFGMRPVNYVMPVNIGSSHTEGVEANITYRPTPFLNVRLNASVFNYAYNYDDFTDSKLSWNARINVWAKLWKRLEVFANARYMSPRLSLYSISVANKGIDFGVSTDFFDRKLSVYLNANDVFGMAEWGNNVIAPQYQTTGSQRYNSRFVSLGLTWRIGKLELESKARQGAAESPMGKS